MSSWYRERHAAAPEAEASPEAQAQAEADATAAAAKLADELGVDLSSVQGSGAEGRIVVGDVQDAYDAASSA